VSPGGGYGGALSVRDVQVIKWKHIYKKKLLKASLCTRKNVFMILNFP
jgi:hypothetical protein